MSGDPNDALSTEGGCTMNASLISLRLLVGLHPLDSLPIIAGCVDEGTYDVEDQADTERRWRTCKKELGVAAEEYEWREVRVDLPAADVLRYFDRPVIHGAVAGCDEDDL